MSRKGISRPMKEQVLEMSRRGVKIKAIARSLSISKNTVKKYLRENSEESSPASPRDWQDTLDWDEIVQLLRQGRTAKQLHEDRGPDGVSYWSFNRHLRSLVKLPTPISLRLHHEPGQTIQIDYSGGISIVDRKTGRQRKTQLFCGVLPFSSRIYAEFSLDQKQLSFMRSQERMWAYFGGVTPYLVLDNLKSGVSKAHQFDPDVNPTFVDFCNHHKVAPLPARPYTPKDKACVEASIGVIKRTFYQQVRDRIFYSLEELNSALREFIDELNATEMKDYGVSRNERFKEESQFLQPLSKEPFEVIERKTCKVHPDCCIQVERNIYSVPWKYCGQSVTVRLTHQLIEIFDGDLNLIATHVRMRGRFKKSIEDAHLPDQSFQRSRFEIKQCIAKAESIGPKTLELVRSQFEGDRPLLRLRRVQGILRILGDPRISREALEFACAQAITFHNIRVDFIKNCATQWRLSRLRSSQQAPKRELATLFLHQLKED